MSNQKIRLLYLVIYLIILFIINYMAFGVWLPPTSSKGLWFYSGAASLIFGSLLFTPYFVRPADAISYLVSALIGIFAFEPNSMKIIHTFPRQLLIYFCLVILIISIWHIIFKDSKSRWLFNTSEIGRIISDKIGSPRFIYSLLLIYSIWEYHMDSPIEVFYLSVAGILITAQQPLETLGYSITRIKNIWRKKSDTPIIGTLFSVQDPNIFLLSLDQAHNIIKGSYVLISGQNNSYKICIILNPYGQDENLLFRAYEINVPEKYDERFLKISKNLPNGFVSELRKNDILDVESEVDFLRNFHRLVGFVTQGTSIERLYFEVIKENEIFQGRLVEAEVSGKRIIYQILDGLTKEEIIHQKNTYGFARCEAIQIGEWDLDSLKFKPSTWIPKMNSPIYLIQQEEREQNKKAVGFFPMSNYFVEIRSLDQLVTHNTAILGILGVGKSMLAIELVERMISQNIKVVCIDLTDQYASELEIFYDKDNEKKKLDIICSAGKKDIDSWNENPSDGGSLSNLKAAIFDDLNSFINSENDNFLKIYNPALILATKQEKEPNNVKIGDAWKRSATLWPVTSVEITSIITESCLELLHNQMSPNAKICIVFEEAHSLVPEWNSAVNEGDRSATNRTARAILQGRKHGLGCLLITQRTANVTKTILNQCNTIFAMRTFDDTGKEFLSNYLGNTYASKLPTLMERHAVVFGKASSCENPVLIRLNDQNDFRRDFRNGDICDQTEEKVEPIEKSKIIE